MMAGYPAAPAALPQGYDPFSAYRYMQQQPANRRQVADHIAQSIMSQPSNTATQGAVQLATGIGMGLAKFNRKDGAFPQAPGGAQPALGTMLGNLFTGRSNGGLY